MRTIQLDLLRALAIVLVLGHHMPEVPQLSAMPQTFFNAWRQIGWIGVDLFFVLSGFLVSGLLYKEYAKTGGFHLGRFLFRRGLKIYPSYYAFLLFSLPAIAWIPGVVTPYSFCCEAVFVSNYFANIWGHTWTLCIEEHFYLLLSLSFFIVTVRKDRFKYFIPGCLFFLILPLCLRLAIIHQIPFHAKPHFVATAFRLDALTFGVLLSYFYHQHEQALRKTVRRLSMILVPIGCAMVLPCAIGGFEQFNLYTFGLTALYMGWGVLLLVAMSYDLKTKNKLILLLAQVGICSYSIYLWHKPFSGLCHLPSDWWPGHLNAGWRLVIYFVGSLSVGMLMSKCIEWPVLRVRDRLFPSRSGSVASLPIVETDTVK